MENIYSAPESELINTVESATQQEFYVVSVTKFTVLFFGTVGLYPLFWFYRNWRVQKDVHGEDIMPFWRTVFRIFFIHSLFSRIEMAIYESKAEEKWQSAPSATLYLLLLIVTFVLDRLSYLSIGSPYTDFSFFPLLIVECFILKRIQILINVVCHDPQGNSNSQYTPANFIWLGIGLLLWLVILLGLYFIVQESMVGEGYN